MTIETEETRVEAALIREIFAIAVIMDDQYQLMDEMLEKYRYWKVLRLTAWWLRYFNNMNVDILKAGDDLASKTGPLSTEELEESLRYWIKRTQAAYENEQKFQSEREQLGLYKDGNGLYRCRGRIEGHHPIFLPTKATFTKKLTESAHLRTLHGGVGYTMAEVRKDYWVPRLRQLSKKVIFICHGCKRFRAVACPEPPPGLLPTDRTVGDRPFQITGVDYAGPLAYKKTAKTEGKAYVLLYCCSLSRAVYIDLLPDLTVEEMIDSLKEFIARRGRPDRIYSDNASTFKAGDKWLKLVMKEEKIHDYLAQHHIDWRFNPSRAPWWGGQYERIVGLVKQSMYKVIGCSTLTFKQLRSVLLDVEITLNNRPLCYVEDEITPILTPNSMMMLDSNFIPDREVDDDANPDLVKRMKYLRSVKDHVWSRWTTEYLRSLRERHNMQHKSRAMNLKMGDVVIIRGDKKNRAHWKTGIVSKLIPGRDGAVRVVKLRAGKSSLERAVQHLYPLEIACDASIVAPLPKVNSDPSDTTAKDVRPRRKAAAIAQDRIQDQLIAEHEDPEVEW